MNASDSTSSSVAWIHLTDLHVGQPKEGERLQNIETAFIADLERVSDVLAQPIDIVFFSGDIVFRGTDSEYIRATALLGRLLARVHELNQRWGGDPGLNPLLIPVPGNHDLVRPSQADASAVTRALGSREPHSPKLWSGAEVGVRNTIEQSFAAYERWLQHHPLPFPSSWTSEGLLPGDRMVEVKRRGLRIGVVALNSAYLQLTGEDLLGKLHVDASQLSQLVSDTSSWASRQHFCVLVTHHSPAWLTDAARQTLNGEIRAHRSFDLHLYGHEHVGAHRTEPGSTGVMHMLEGRSLFGAEEQGFSRMHGYGVGRFVLDGKAKRIETWTRPGWRDSHGWRFEPGHGDYGRWRLTIDLGETAAKPATEDTRTRAWNPQIGDRNPDSGRWQTRSTTAQVAELFRPLGPRHWIFLSASIPDDMRVGLSTQDRKFIADLRPSAIEAFVKGLAAAISERDDLGLVFGGHPAIVRALAPMIIASRRKDWLVLFQDSRYQSSFIEELGVVAHAPAVVPVVVPEDRGEKCQTMRELMASTPGLVGAVFVGGKSGIIDEFDQIGAHARVWRIAVGVGGGAAASLLLDSARRAYAVPADMLSDRLWSSPADAVAAIMERLPTGTA